MNPRLIAAACVISAVEVPLMAQGIWSEAAAGPSARHRHVMAHDNLRGRTVLFGGLHLSSPGTNEWLADTWEFDGANWIQVSSAGPSARCDVAMAFDAAHGEVVLFGGYDASGGQNHFHGDTWVYDGAWVQAPATGPTARGGAAMAYDSLRGRVILFGGNPGNGGPVADTWEWDGSSWLQVNAAGPSSRSSHAMAFDIQRGRAVLFGGLGYGGAFLSDTWEFDGGSWVQVASTGPSGRYGHSIAYQGHRHRTVLFGGYHYAAPNNVFHGDTWEWDGASWVVVSSAGPAGRTEQALAYDVGRSATVLFGGISNSPSAGVIYYSDTWEWSSGSPSSAIPFGSGCGLPALVLQPIPGALPTVNTTAQALMTNIPSSIAFVSLGWSRTMAGPFLLPFSMLWYGMPGCFMLQSTEAAAQPVTFTGTGTATYDLHLPNWSGLVGLHIYLQGWAAAPGANPGGVIVSNGVEWVIGNL